MSRPSRRSTRSAARAVQSQWKKSRATAEREARAARKKAYNESPIMKRMKSLYAKSKKDVIAIADAKSRIDMSHLIREPKDVVISHILEAEFGRKALQEWNALRPQRTKRSK